MLFVKTLLSEQNTIPSIPLSMPLTMTALGSTKYWNDRVLPALQDLQKAINAGEIYNTRFKDAVSTINNALEKTLANHFRDPFVYGGKDIQGTFDEYYYGTHDLRKMKKVSEDKKIATIAAGRDKFSQGVKAYLEVAKEYAPIQDAVVHLKSLVKSGREPKAEIAPPKNPDQTRATCSWCLRNIAHDNGKMAHHGYERPGEGYQTASCPGIRYKPLEQSTEGLEARIKAAHNTAKFHDEKIKSAHTIKEFRPMVKVQISPPGKWPKQYKEEQVVVDKSHPKFNDYHETFVREHQKSKKWAEDDANHLTNFLTKWKMEHK